MAARRMNEPNYPTRIGLERALEIVVQRARDHRLPDEAVALRDCHGRILAADIHAPIALPPFANSAMDGFALRAADLPVAGERAFELVGEVFAGGSSIPTVGPGQCVRVTTGAPMPAGADTVVVKENVRTEADRVIVRAGEKACGNVRAAGEDFALGARALVAGARLGAPQLAVLAALGCGVIPVRRVPRIAVIVTGDELAPIDSPLGFGQIHDSNGVMLSSLVRESDAVLVSCRRAGDDSGALRASLLDAEMDADIIVTSGGVSMGEADHLPAVMAVLGDVHFHKLRIKPGMPALFGQIGTSLVFGLPGNPVSAAVTFRVLVRLALSTIRGELPPPVRRARLAGPVHKRHARAEFVRCALQCDGDGVLWATLHPAQGSHMLSGLVESEALALLAEDPRTYARGDVVTIWPG
jgi:molybdopterin molybdotransferase